MVSAFVGSNPTTPARIVMLNNVFLSLNHCGFAFGKRKIFDDISLSIHRDDKTALVGKNGVEKVIEINLSKEEKDQFNKSVKAVQELFEAAKKIDNSLNI